MSNPNQDWTPTVLVRTKTKTEMMRDGAVQTVRKTSDNKQTSAPANRQMATDFDPENIKAPTKAGSEIKQALQLARQAKKMSQSDLDKACAFPKNTVQNYENGTAVINPEQINKMNRVLGVKLPRQ